MTGRMTLRRRKPPGGLEETGFAFRRPLSAAKILVPASVELRKGHLDYQFALDLEGKGQRFPGSGLLEQFAALGDPDVRDEAILRFAQNWGILGICRHGEPGFHGRYESRRGKRALVWCIPPDGISLKGREPVDAWRRIANKFGRIVKLAGTVAHEAPTNEGDWLSLGAKPIELESWGYRLEGRRHFLASLVTAMMRAADVRLQLAWLEEGSPELRIGGQSLHAALVAQLALTIGKGTDVLLCWECKKAFRGRPAAGMRRFCPECQEKGIPVSLASRDYRKRQAKSRALISRRP